MAKDSRLVIKALIEAAENNANMRMMTDKHLYLA